MMYTMIKSKTENDLGELVAVYGISCATQSIPDISDDEARMLRLVADCNELQLDPIHLHDVVEDLLNS